MLFAKLPLKQREAIVDGRAQLTDTSERRDDADGIKQRHVVMMLIIMMMIFYLRLAPLFLKKSQD